MPNLRQLQAFKEVMETRSISRAAERLFLTQPAVSKLIQSLEAECGLRLFIRHKQRIAPTAEAHLYLAETENLFWNLTRLERLALDLKSMVLTNLTVACYPALAIDLMSRIINGFQRHHEGTTATLMIPPSPRMGDIAIAQQFDVGISLLPVRHQDVISMHCLREEMVVIMPPGHRLAARKEIHVRELEAEAFVSMGYDDRSSFIVDDYFLSAGVSRNVVGRVALSAAICEFVRDGAGISVIGTLTAAGATATGLVSARLRPRLYFDSYLLVPRQRPASAIREKFLGHLREELASAGRGVISLPWKI